MEKVLELSRKAKELGFSIKEVELENEDEEDEDTEVQQANCEGFKEWKDKYNP